MGFLFPFYPWLSIVGPTNKKLRVHLPLLAPTGGLSRLRVGLETREAFEGRALVFDDSYEHEAWNDGETERHHEGDNDGAHGSPRTDGGGSERGEGGGGGSRGLEATRVGCSGDELEREEARRSFHGGGCDGDNDGGRAGGGGEDSRELGCARGRCGGSAGEPAKLRTGAIEVAEEGSVRGDDNCMISENDNGRGYCPLGKKKTAARSARARASPRITLIADVWHPDLSHGLVPRAELAGQMSVLVLVREQGVRRPNRGMFCSSGRSNGATYK